MTSPYSCDECGYGPPVVVTHLTEYGTVWCALCGPYAATYLRGEKTL